MNTTSRFAFAALATLLAATAAQAQEQEDSASTFNRIKGGAVYDFTYGVDGSAVSEEYFLVHVVCTDASKSLRVMLPASPDDDGVVFDSDGPKSTLMKKGDGYQVTFRANGRNIAKSATQLQLDAANTAFATLLAQPNASVNFSGQMFTKENQTALLSIIARLESKVATEQARDAGLRGQPQSRCIRPFFE